MSPELAGLGGLFAFAAAWELAGLGHPAVRRTGEVIRETVAPGRVGGLACGALSALAIVPGAPGRIAPILAVGLVAAGWLAPKALADRRVRRRRAELVTALPDALDLIAVGAAAGRTPAALLRELASGGKGALAAELGNVVAEIDCGVPQTAAFAGLRERTGAPELGALAAAVERSRRYGSPLADQLHAQAATLRIDERRRIEEHAARAAPKIQLVVAMVLVPSALLIIAAALIAHSDVLFGSF